LIDFLQAYGAQPYVHVMLYEIRLDVIDAVCTFELMMIREGVLSVPGVPLTTEDCTVLIRHLLT